jgi:hypothetical protein
MKNHPVLDRVGIIVMGVYASVWTMKRDNHRSHVSTIPRMKRMIQRIWTFNDFEEWKAKNLPINWYGERSRMKQAKGLK